MANERKPDFSGWATVNDVKCSDGRTIRKNAFIDCDGEEVPLVFQHIHSDPENVLGHALLENRDEGVYCYGWFNTNPKAKAAKVAVDHRDIRALSIYANQLVQKGSDVIHGMIREVSLVYSGANKEARIENVSFAHGDGTTDVTDDEALIYSAKQNLELYHEEAEEEEKEMEKQLDIQEVLDGMTEEQLAVVNALYEQGQIDALESLEEDDEDEEEEVDDEETEEEEDADEEEEAEDEKEAAAAHSNDGGKNMKHNVFDGSAETNEKNTLSHAETEVIFKDAKRCGSLKESFLAHVDEYGITQIDWLFPEYKNLNNPPEFIKRDTGWVSHVMGKVHHTPFSRIKSMFADLTEDEARAMGYIKGNLKKEEVFTLLRRTTDPQTIYKKQKLDRDDVIDITDFDVVAWIKGEMRMMLDEEIARAILIGDGRSGASADHISQDHIRSVWNDADLFSVKVAVAPEAGVAPAKTLIKNIIKNRKLYKGSGNPTFYTTEDVLTQMLLLDDGIGHFLYPTVQALATTLRVADIVTVPVMEQAGTRTGADSTDYELLGILVNLADYNVGADKGGSVNMFDDFDIDYNQQKYLIETRCSGALIKPFSALVFEADEDDSFMTIDPSIPAKPWVATGDGVQPQPEVESGNP